MLTESFRNVRFAIRALMQAPLFSGLAVATLALGIGAAAGVFTVVNAVLLDPLPLRDPARLAVIYAEDAKLHAGQIGASWTKYQQLESAIRNPTSAIESLGASVGREFAVTTGDAPVQAHGARVTAGFFGVLGVAPAMGRAFRNEDEKDGAAPVAVVTDAFWRQKLGADSAIVGRAVNIDAKSTTILGVLPPDFKYAFSEREPQVFLTQVSTPDVLTAPQVRNGAGFLEYVVRLKPDATVATAQRQLDAFDANYRNTFGNYADAGRYALRIARFTDNLVGDLRAKLYALMAAVLLLLLITCANVAHLTLARATGRRREVAIRLALGASRADLARQFLVESLLLALAGGALGVVAARWAVALLIAHGPTNIPRLAGASPDWHVVVFAAASACATAVIFGLIPVLRIDATAGALQDGRSGGVTRGAGRLHRWIAASETAVTVMLLIAAGLLGESVINLQAVDVGFDPQHVYAAQIGLPRGKYTTPVQREQFFTQLIGEIQSQPGIGAAGATSYLPMGGNNYGFFFFIDGQPRLGVGKDSVTSVRHVSPDYFKAMHIPLKAGRPFADSDAAGAPPVAIINDTFARKYFANVNPLGRHVASSGDSIMREIVGIVRSVRFDGPAREDEEELYLPYRQVPWPSMALVVSSTLSPDAVASAIRESVSKLDRDQAIAAIRPMPRVVAATTTQEQFTGYVIATFALLATALAAVGLYGVVALFVGQKRRELGIRMALGAQRADVLALVLRQGGSVVGAGLIAGLAGAAAASGLLRGLLFGVTATQPAMYAAAAAVVAAVGLAASYVPARRATTVSPIEALRAE